MFNFLIFIRRDVRSVGQVAQCRRQRRRGRALLASCAVGPDFFHPAAPEPRRYTKEPLTARTSSTDAPTGQSQHFTQGRDIPQEWWTLFKSPALNALVERR